MDRLSAGEASRIDAGKDYIAEYNRVLSRWYEQEIASCE